MSLGLCDRELIQSVPGHDAPALHGLALFPGRRLCSRRPVRQLIAAERLGFRVTDRKGLFTSPSVGPVIAIVGCHTVDSAMRLPSNAGTLRYFQ